MYPKIFARLVSLVTILAIALPFSNAGEQTEGKILTPKAGPEPRINGPKIFGVTPGNPVVFTIPASGARPVEFQAQGLPAGLKLDSATGSISGALLRSGTYPVLVTVRNAHGEAKRRFTLVCGEEFSLTPPMGWNSWNCWGMSVDQKKVLAAAKAMKAHGLDQHGWSYINIDDGWQGKRGGQENAIQPNDLFADLQGLSKEIHRLGLRFGIYSSPWITTYGNRIGGTADNPEGLWTQIDGGWNEYSVNHRQGIYSFASQDARQFAAWEVDYLKYDWFPNNLEHTREMSLALRATGRDIHFSLSNNTSLKIAKDLAAWANSWRTTGDIVDEWETPSQFFEHSVTEIGFNQDRWIPHQRPGHFNDADMLVLGHVGWGPNLHPSHLTPAEQYSHFSLWCMLSTPLLLGCDLEKLDEFTLGLITNDEVIAVNQDTSVTPGRRVATLGAVDVYRKDLEDGTVVLGFFSRAINDRKVSLKINEQDLNGTYAVRDLWRQKDIGDVKRDMTVEVEAHGVTLLALREKPDAATK